MSDIRLSKKYGLNPTIPVCFFCHKEKSEIVFLGHIGGRGKDLEAPKRCIIDYEPCDSCKAQFAKGVLIVSVSKIPLFDNQPPISRDYYPTGMYAVVKSKAIEGAKAGDIRLMPDNEYRTIFSGKEER